MLPADLDARAGEETLAQRLARLEREREEADRRYNDALTALDRAVTSGVAAAPLFSPPAVDLSRLSDLNQQWQTRPEPPPPADRSIRGRLRTFVWRLLGPPLEAQQTFNATLVDHLNRNAAPAEGTQQAITHLVSLVEAHQAARARFEAHLIQYLQTITWYVDTKDRSSAAGALVLNSALSALNDEWLKRWESLQAREARFTQHVHQLVTSIDEARATSAIAQQTSLSLKRDVERLLESGAASVARPAVPAGDGTDPRGAGALAASDMADLDAFQYLSFENAFRGSPEDIRRRLAEYLPRFEGRSDVLELGCGRGEFLDLLRERGISARGLDTNEAMVQETRARGLEAVRADALEYLLALPDASLGGVFAAQVVEHLEPAYLGRLIEAAGHKLRPGGLLVLETINPSCWVAFFESYIRDLTHVRPLHPETLQFLVRAAGFQRVDVEYRSPVPEAEKLAALPWNLPSGDDTLQVLVEHANAQVEKLNRRLFGYQDYAVVGER